MTALTTLVRKTLPSFSDAADPVQCTVCTCPTEQNGHSLRTEALGDGGEEDLLASLTAIEDTFC